MITIHGDSLVPGEPFKDGDIVFYDPDKKQVFRVADDGGYFDKRFFWIHHVDIAPPNPPYEEKEIKEWWENWYQISKRICEVHQRVERWRTPVSAAGY